MTGTLVAAKDDPVHLDLASLLLNSLPASL